MLQTLGHRVTIQFLVHLRTHGMHRRPFGRIQHTHLNQAFVCNLAHTATHCIQLAHQMRLCRPANRGVARKKGDMVQANRTKQGLMPHLGTRQCCFTAGMAPAHYNHIVGCRIIIDFIHNNSAPIYLNRISRKWYQSDPHSPYHR